MFFDISDNFSIYRFAHFKINLYLCTRNESTLWDYVVRVGDYRHNKGVISALFLAFRNLENSTNSKTMQQLMSSGYVIHINAHHRIGVCDCTYRRGLGVACSELKAIQGLEMRNSNSAVPLFLYKCRAFVWKRSTISQVTAFLCTIIIHE